MIRGGTSEESITQPLYIMCYAVGFEAIFAQICCAIDAEVFWVSSQDIFQFFSFYFGFFCFHFNIVIKNLTIWKNCGRNFVSNFESNFNTKSCYKGNVDFKEISLNTILAFFSVILVENIISHLPDHWLMFRTVHFNFLSGLYRYWNLPLWIFIYLCVFISICLFEMSNSSKNAYNFKEDKKVLYKMFLFECVQQRAHWKAFFFLLKDLHFRLLVVSSCPRFPLLLYYLNCLPVSHDSFLATVSTVHAVGGGVLTQERAEYRKIIILPRIEISPTEIFLL